MARSHGKETRVLVNDAHLSGSISGWRFEHRRLLSDDTNLLSSGDQWQPGQLAGSVGVTGMFDAATITPVIDTAAAADGTFLVTQFPVTPAVGSLAFISEGNISSRDYPGAVKDLVRLNITGTPNDGVDMGNTLHVLGAETADANGSSVDNAASSANGAVASFHLTAYTGLTDISVKIQHAPDDSTWADLITFTTATGVTWERKTASGTIDRYLRATWDVTGTGSATFAVVCARR